MYMCVRVCASVWDCVLIAANCNCTEVSHWQLKHGAPHISPKLCVNLMDLGSFMAQPSLKLVHIRPHATDLILKECSMYGNRK